MKTVKLLFQGGIYSFQLVDWYVTSFGVPLFCLLECILIGWIYGNIFSIHYHVGMPKKSKTLVWHFTMTLRTISYLYSKVKVGKDQEKVQSEKDSHSKNRGGKN